MPMTNITNHFSWMIGGPQGAGVDSSASLFLRTCAVAGLYAYGKREYHSNIMGEHSYFQVRVSENPVHSHIDSVHLLVTFDNETALIHADEVIPNGFFLYDERVTDPAKLKLDPRVRTLAIPYQGILEGIAQETGQSLDKLQIMKNTIAVGASLALLELDIKYLEQALKGTFIGDKAKLVALNLKVAQKAYDFIQENPLKEFFSYQLAPLTGNPAQLIMSGTTACALGKLKAGCKFQTYYPITPASDESVYLESKPEYGINVVQAEDEVAAFCMAVGSAITGVRSSTSTSGPGFSLMAEGIGWAGINEVPVVIFDYQRGGPSTGLPTRHEQGDLLFALFIGHGEFPRIVLAPGDMEECFSDSFHAFNDAERYQVPVIVLCDKALGNNTQTIAPFDESQLLIDRGNLVSQDELTRLAQVPDFNGQYQRFFPTENGISPRPLPGQKDGLFWMTGDEHDNYGHISEDPDNRLKMQKKRMDKLRLASQEIEEERQWKLYGPGNANITIVSWGSTKGPIIDALPILHSDGLSVNFLQVRMMSPFPVEAVKRILSQAETIICIEMNYTGQLAKVIRMETGISMDHQILKYTGRPMSETEILRSLQEIIQQKSDNVVLHYGK